ncbi:MAG: NUDIX hydrolase [Dehalococcoidia bacterium]
MPNNYPEILNSKKIYDGEKFSLQIKNLKNYKGEKYNKEIIKHPGSVVILPITQDNKIILIEQYRLAIGKTIIELPAGTIEKNEDHDLAANRELREETGFRAKNIKLVHKMWVAPGYSSECCYFYLAENLVPDPLPSDLGEDIIVLRKSINDVKDMMISGEIEDQMTIASLLYFFYIKET